MKHNLLVIAAASILVVACTNETYSSNEVRQSQAQTQDPQPVIAATEEYKTVALSDDEKIALGIVIEDAPDNSGVIYTGSVTLENPRISPNTSLLQNGDLIVRFHDEPVHNKDDIQRILAGMQPNISAVVIVYRDGSHVSITVSPGVVDKNDQAAST